MCVCMCVCVYICVCVYVCVCDVRSCLCCLRAHTGYTTARATQVGGRRYIALAPWTGPGEIGVEERTEAGDDRDVRIDQAGYNPRRIER